MKLWLDRPDIKGSLKDFLRLVTEEFQLGTIQKFSRFPIGYQELNIKLHTSQGIFVVKIFSREKSLSRVKENVEGYIEFAKLGVPTPKLRVTKDNEYIFLTKGKTQEVYTCVMEFFKGKSFLKLPIKNQDIMTISRFMALMHRSALKPAHYNDTLGIVNFKDVFDKQENILPQDERKEMRQILEEFQVINFSKFHHSVIHGTLERENVLKDMHGNYCVLDLGCMDYNASVIDTATFLANFTIYMGLEETVLAIKDVVEEYKKFHYFSREEQRVLPVLVKTQYAILVIGMTH